MLILLLVGSSLLGITLIRVRGWYSLTRIKQQLTQGQLPTDALFGSLRWLVAGILFVIRSRFVFFQQNIFKTGRTFYSSQNNPPRDGEIFEAECEKEADENKRLK